MSWLRSARTIDGALVDVEITNGRIAQVITASPASSAIPPPSIGPDDTDLSGHVLLPSFVEPHAHLDKAMKR